MSRFSGILKHSLGAASATMLSRVLGLVRTMLEARVLGGGFAASAWQLAFMIPNMFRRLLGEGALAAALIPIVSATEAGRGRDAAKRQIAVVFAALGVLLSLLVALGIGAALLIENLWPWEPDGEYGYVQLALRLLVWLMPYAFFMCLVGVAAALLNLRRAFFLPAAGALILNIMTVVLLGVCYKFNTPYETVLVYLCIVVLLSGLLNLLFLIFLLYRFDIMPHFRGLWKERRVLNELGRLMLPGLVGYSVLQLSFLADSILAASLGPHAVPAINYSNRIIDLPIGMYALSIGAVLLPTMSRSAANAAWTELREDLNCSLRNVIFVGVPIAVYSGVFTGLILSALYSGGRFDALSLRATSGALGAYSIGIPFFCMVKILQPAFYARREMKKPMYSSMICVGVNIVLSLILMRFIAQSGIALATALAAMLNNAILLRWLSRDGFGADFSALGLAALRALTAAAAAAAAVWGAFRWVGEPGKSGAAAWGLLLGSGAAYLAVYWLLSHLMHGREFRECVELFSLRRKEIKDVGSLK